MNCNKQIDIHERCIRILSLLQKARNAADQARSDYQLWMGKVEFRQHFRHTFKKDWEKEYRDKLNQANATRDRIEGWYATNVESLKTFLHQPMAEARERIDRRWREQNPKIIVVEPFEYKGEKVPDAIICTAYEV